MNVNHVYHPFQNSVYPLFKSSVLKNVFILCEHGMKANIGGAKMANNRQAVNKNFAYTYWTLDGLSLYSCQTAC